MSPETIDVPSLNVRSATDLDIQSVNLSKQVGSLKVNSQEGLETASGLRKNLKELLSKIDVTRKNITKPLDEAKKNVMNLFRPIETAIENNLKHVDSLIITYTDGQEKLRAEQELKLRRQAEAEEKKKRDALEERARKAAESGKAEKAAELQQKAAEVQVTAPTLAPTFQKPSGLSFRENWSAQVVDIKALAKAVAEGRVSPNFICGNMPVLNAQARATKDSLPVDGVKFNCEKSTVGR